MRPRDWPKVVRYQVATVLFALSAIAAPQPGTIDPTFSAGRGPIQVVPGTGWGAVLQGDGKTVIGGTFNGINLDSSSPVVRFNSDGSLDTTFDTASIEIDAIAYGFFTKPLCIQSNGQIIVGGQFDTSDDAYHSLLRLNSDGSLDNSFNPVLETGVEGEPPVVSTGILQPDGKLLISGGFSKVNGVSRPSLARLNTNGTLDTGFVPAAGGVKAALQPDGKVLVTAASGVIRLNSDGSKDFTFNSDVKASALFLQSDGKIIVSEDVFFGEIFQTSRLNGDGSPDQSYAGTTGFAVGLDSNDRSFLVATLSYPGFERLNVDGTIDSTFQPCDNCGGFMVVEQSDEKLVVVGQFPEAPFGVRRLLAAGELDLTFEVGSGLTTIYGGSIAYAQLMPDGKIIVSGSFTHIDSLPRDKLARLNHDGTPDPDFDAGNLLMFLNYPPTVLAQPDGKVFVVTNNEPNELVRLGTTGEIDPTFQFSGAAFPFALQRDGKLLVATGEGFMRLNSDGTPDSSFDPGLDAGSGVSQAFVQPGGKILIHGVFTSIHGVPRFGTARLNSDGSLDEGIDLNLGIFGELVAVQADGKVLIATLVPIEGYSLGRVNSDGTADESFEPVMKIPIPSATALEQDGIYLNLNTLTRLHIDGTVDPSFAPVFASDAFISQLLRQIDGQIIAAGGFTEVNGVAVNGIVRLNGVAPEKVANISTRALVGTGDAVEIGGFIVTGAVEKSVLIRAIGPSLQVDGSPLPGILSNPRLELHDSIGQLIGQNDDWRESQEAEIIASGLAPLNDQESAIAATLTPGAYTAVVQGSGGETGIGLVEVYDTSPASDSRLQNISTRGSVQSGDDVMIAGLILSGPESAPIVARAIGPSLTASDIADPLDDPTIELHDQSGAIIASNDDWKETQEAELMAAGLAPTNDKEAALLATLPPGPYTAIVRGANGATGVGLVEFYDTR
jgi:uncharacterized delta-60 repeat protein